MARRKTPRAPRRRPATKRSGARRSRTRAAGAQPKKRTARKSRARPARVAARKGTRAAKTSARPARPRKASAEAARLRSASTKPARKAPRTTAARAARKTVAVPKAPRRAATSGGFVARKAPALNRERRIVLDEDMVPTPPSSLDMDRSASAVRSGRHELHERFVEHTETGPAITGGDIDADWESAYSVGDEAPGGDNPTPDQDIVDDIGRAIGVQYEDNEELKAETKIAERDRKRWELDPASSEDYNER